MKRAQAAMEFLMTYGWAILVVLVAIGALAYFGVLSPDRFLPEKCVLSTGSGLFCDKFTITATGIEIKVQNSLAEGITVTGGTIIEAGIGTAAIPITALPSPALRIGSQIDGTTDQLTLCITPLANNTDGIGSLTIKEFT